MRKMLKARSTTAKLFTTTALLALIAAPAALAQTGNKMGTSGASNQSQMLREAPVGHRQPRADQVPSEKSLSDPNNPVNKEDAALDRKIRSICRGCKLKPYGLCHFAPLAGRGRIAQRSG